MKANVWGVLACIVIGTGCSRTRTLPLSLFDGLAGADRIEVNTPSQHVRTVVGTRAIAKVAELLKTYSSGWHKPWHGAPVPEVELHFYKGDDALGVFGLGHGYLTGGERQFLWQALPEKDRTKLLRLLAIRDLGAMPNRN